MSVYEETKHLHGDIDNNKAAILDAIHSTDQFLRDKRAKLSPEKVSELQDRLADLRKQYDLLTRKSEDVYRTTESTLNRMRVEEEERVKLREQYAETKEQLRTLTDWLTNAEHQLGSEQPIQEQIRPLTDQNNKHKVLHEDIVAHQGPVLETVQEGNQLLKQKGDRLSDDERTTLKTSMDDLKSRYENANVQSTTRSDKLRLALDDLHRLEPEMADMEEWLRDAEQRLEKSSRRIETDTGALEKQYEEQKVLADDVVTHRADVKFINMTGQAFIDNAKLYKEDLSNYRSTALPRQFGQTFSEAPESHATRDKLASINTRYERLKSRCLDHRNRLGEVVEKQRRYSQAVNPTLPWLDQTYATLSSLVQEPVATEPSAVQRQIDQLKAINDEVVLHGKDLDAAREAGRELVEAHEEVKPDVQRQTREMGDRYGQLEAMLTDRNNLLQTALTESQSIQDGLDSLLRWLEDTEATLNRLEQRTPISLRKELLADLIQQYRKLLTDIENRKPSVDAINKSADKLMSTTNDPAMARALQSKLASLNSRYEQLAGPARASADFLQRLSDRLGRVHEEVDTLEDWLIPTLDLLKAPDFGRKDLTELATVLQNTQTQTDRNKPQYTEIHQLADELLKERRVSDPAALNLILQNLDDNWQDLQELLAFRSRQLEERRAAQQAYNNSLKDVSSWLISVERRFNSFKPVAKELVEIKSQYDELKPLRKEVNEYRPNVDELNEQGTRLDTMLHDVQSAPTRAHRRSAQILTSTPKPQSAASRLRRPFEEADISGLMEEESEIQRQLGDVNRRYQALDIKIDERDDELDTALALTERSKPVDELLDWVQVTEVQLAQSAPQLDFAGEDDLENLMVEFDKIQAVEEDIVQSQAPVAHAAMGADQLIKDKGKKLRPEQHQNLQTKHTDLKNRYDDLASNIKQKKQNLEQTINRVKTEKEQKSVMSRRLGETQAELSDLLDWMSKTEQKLGVQQPISEQVKPLSTQLQRHNSLHEDIADHEPQVSQAVNDVTMLLREFEGRLPAEDAKALQQDRDDLKRRFDAANGQSLTRRDKLAAAADDLEKYREEFEEFDDWLTGAEKTHEKLVRDEAGRRDLEAVRQQIEEEKDLMEEISDHKGDLKFINRAGHKLVDNAKAFKQMLQDYRTKALPAQFNRTFAETPDSNVIRDELADLYERYTKLRSQSRDHYRSLKELVTKQQKWEGSCGVVLPWIRDAHAELSDVMREPIATEPENIRAQMEKLKDLHDQIVLHTKDVEKLKDYGKDLANTQDAVKDDVLRTVRDVSDKYSFMEAQLAERSNQLQSALTQSHSVQDSIDSLLRWLEQAEKNTNRVVNAPIIIRKEALLELIQDHKYVQSDIDTHKPTLDALNDRAETLLASSDAQTASKVQARLDDLNGRYGRIATSVRNHGDYLQKMLTKMNQLHAQVEDFEDWLMPAIERLESKELNRMDLLEMGSKLMEYQRDIDEHRYTYQDIKRLGQEITRDPKTSDTSRIADTVGNLTKNWEVLEALLKRRNNQLQQRQETQDKFTGLLKAAQDWLDRMEDKVDRLPVVAIDPQAIKQQIEQYQPLQGEYDSFTNKIDEVNHVGLTFENLTADPDLPTTKVSPLKRSKIFMSSRAGSETRSLDTRSTGSRRSSLGSELDQSAFLMDDGLTETQRNLADVNERYQTLGDKLADRKFDLDDALDKGNLFRSELGAFVGWLDGVEDTLKQEVPPGMTAEEAERRLQDHMILVADIQDHAPHVTSLRGLCDDLTGNRRHQQGADVIIGQVDSAGKFPEHGILFSFF
ncbi:microtubule-actin cross-linking factor 1, isoforms 6/7-like [Diadema antillarum]|uniref:microtubule-actin cross-linking factor 1, isoforms 6/7-like n=1 Tax=Diadema antillarum TaxID=105358 RepID=UPI003A8C5F4E